MTSAEFISRLRGVLLAALAIALVLRFAAGAQAFSFYGPALSVALTLPVAGRLIGNRLAELGRSRRWALLYTVPAALAAALQIGFWLAFFHGPGALAIQLGVVRQLLHEAGIGLWAGIALFVALAILAGRLAEHANGD